MTNLVSNYVSARDELLTHCGYPQGWHVYPVDTLTIDDHWHVRTESLTFSSKAANLLKEIRLEKLPEYISRYDIHRKQIILNKHIKRSPSVYSIYRGEEFVLILCLDSRCWKDLVHSTYCDGLDLKVFRLCNELITLDKESK